jgi:hypothetical protein
MLLGELDLIFFLYFWVIVGWMLKVTRFDYGLDVEWVFFGTFTFHPLVWTPCSDLSLPKSVTQFCPYTFTVHLEISSRRYFLPSRLLQVDPNLTGGPIHTFPFPLFFPNRIGTAC